MPFVLVSEAWVREVRRERRVSKRCIVIDEGSWFFLGGVE